MYIHCLINNISNLVGAFRLLGLACAAFIIGCDPQPAFAQSVIRTLSWELDTSRPATIEWALVRGETADLECRYLSGSSSMDVRGAAVVLHCRTNGMPADLSFQVTGGVGRVASTNLSAVGWVTVRVRPDLDLPHDVTRCSFALETTLNDARNLVATGLLRLSGDPTGATPSALPLYQYDAAGSAQQALDAALQAVSDAAAARPTHAAVTGIVDAATSGLATQQALSDAAAARPTHAAVTGIVDAATSGLATQQALSDAAAARPTHAAVTGIVDAALARLPSGAPGSADALRVVDSTNSPAQWFDSQGNLWSNVVAESGASYRWSETSPFGIYGGESWGFSGIVETASIYTNHPRPDLTWTPSEPAANGGYWQLPLSTPMHEADAAGDAASFELTDYNIDSEIIMERVGGGSGGTVVLLVDAFARQSDLDALPPSGLTQQQVDARIAAYVFGSLTLSSPLTNALLRLTWDPTNQTLAAQEILP